MIRLFYLLNVLVFTLPAFAQSPDSLHWLQFGRQLDSLQTSAILQHGSVAACIQATQGAAPLLAYNARRSLPPASVMKLITTATAFAVLGETYTYQTTLLHDGLLRGDTLFGNLRLVGTGDPSLGSGRFANYPDWPGQLAQWVEAVKRAGIRVVLGRVLTDDTVFDENATPGGWPYDDLGNYYGAGATGLMVAENSYRLVFQPADSLGGPAPVLRTEPPIPYLTFRNRVRTDSPGTGDQVNIFGGIGDRQPLLEGYVPQGTPEFSVKGSLPDPGYFAAISLQNALIQAGLKVGQEAASLSQLRRQQPGLTLPPPALDLLVTLSPPLRDLARECNFQSINLYAEAFLKKVGLTMGYGTTTPQAVNALKQVWRNKAVDLSGFRPLDGSGLSPQNGLTAQNMVGILTAAAREPWFPAFYASIPVLGVSGTVRNLGRKTRAAGNVRAKSGSIGGVRCYAGYYTARNGEFRAFCFMLNQYDPDAGAATKELEKLMVAMAEI